MALVAVANGQGMTGSQVQQLIDLLKGVMTDQPITIRHASTTPLTVDRSDAAGIKGLIVGQRAAATKWLLGLDASDQFAVLNAAGNAVNLGLTDLGAGTFRAGLTVGGALAILGALTGATTGAFSGDVTTTNLILSGSAPAIVGGSVSAGITNNAISRYNLFVNDAGDVTAWLSAVAPYLKATGAPSLGSAAAGRYVGNWTTFGAPTGLTGAIGDFGFDGNGAIWICDAAGTPGTWHTLPMGMLAGGYAQQSASQTLINAPVDLTSLAVAVTVGSGRRIRISSLVPFSGTVSTDNYVVAINEGATVLAGSNSAVLAAAAGGAARTTFATSVILQPTAGSHSYKMTATRSNGTGTGSTLWSSTQPVWMMVEDIGV